MDAKTRKRLNELLNRELDFIQEYEPGDDEYYQGLERIERIQKLLGCNERKAIDEKFIIEKTIEVAAFVVPIVAYSCWFHKGLKFEETGAVGSMWNRNLIGGMRPKL